MKFVAVFKKEIEGKGKTIKVQVLFFSLFVCKYIYRFEKIKSNWRPFFGLIFFLFFFILRYFNPPSYLYIKNNLYLIRKKRVRIEKKKRGKKKKGKRKEKGKQRQRKNPIIHEFYY